MREMTTPHSPARAEPSARRPRICFVAHNAFGALTGEAKVHAGGIERQQALMAKWLARHGYPVAMIVWDEGPSVPRVHDGVELYKLCGRDDGLRGLRFFHPRWTSLLGALARADADVYYYNLGDLGLGQIAQWTRLRGRRLVFSVACNGDVDPALPALAGRRDRILYRWGVQRCDAIIVQTDYQQRALKQHFGLESTVLPMPCEGIDIEPRYESNDSFRVLWIGRISAEKRADWLLDLAERLPGVSFEIVGAPNAETPYARDVLARAQAMPNVTVVGRVPYDRMVDCYARASILCSTSEFEGFPNVYLEAWSAGIPVVSTFDPDDLIKTRGLGTVASTREGLVEAIDALARSPELRRSQGERARNYFRENHGVDDVMPKFAAAFARTAGFALS